MELIYLPSLNELRPVDEAELQGHGPATYLLDAMARLQIGCFADEGGTYWFGSADPNFIEHDRWLCTMDAWYLEQDGYGSRWVDVLTGCEPTFSDKPGTADLEGHLRSLAWAKERVRVRLAPEVAQRQRVAGDFLVANRELGSMLVPEKESLTPRLLAATEIRWTQDQHDIVNHWDAWCTVNNPDGLPRELVLRMYGLKAYLPGGPLA
jgi:hypothetical protein